MKNTTILVLIAVIVVGVGFFIYNNSNESVISATQVGGNLNGQVQKVVISERDLNYYPNTINVKAGQPVSISLDSSVTGCLRSFTIRDLGVSKYLKSTSDTLDFTPTKKGTFAFSCSMGMGYGKLVVE